MSKKKAHLTAEQADTIQAYIWQIRDLMGLRHWDVYLAAKPAPRDANAMVHPVDGRLVCPLFVARNWWENRTPDEKRNDIVHELIHVMHRDQTDLIRLAMAQSGYLPEKATTLLWTAFKQQTEILVDHLASVIAPTMPAWVGIEPDESSEEPA